MEVKSVQTVKELEAIYEYSDHGPKNLARIIPENRGVVIELRFNGGRRSLTLKDESKNINATYELVSPKKPLDTGVVLKILAHNKNIFVPENLADQLLEMFPEAIQIAD